MTHDAELEAKVAILVEALPFIQEFRGQTFVIKYGGSAMDDPAHVDRLLRDVVFLEAVGINPVLVHGGGKSITKKMQSAGLVARFVNGLRVTDARTIELVEEALDREINPGIVETICRFGGHAHGLSGREVFVAKPVDAQPDTDGNLVDVGFVGEAAKVVADAVRHLVDREIVPVISPIGADDAGKVLNINADVAASALAVALQASKLVFVSDVRGVLRDPSDPDSLIPTVQTGEVETLARNGILKGGMIPKVQSAAAAVLSGVGKVHMICGAIAHCLLLEIFTKKGIGTEIRL